jgi:hypothetical protein
MQVDAIGERPGQARPIPHDVGGRADAGMGGIARMTARARIHRRGEREARREAQRGLRAGDRDGTVFHGLTQRLEHPARKFQELVQKEHAMVRQAHLARPRR